MSGAFTQEFTVSITHPRSTSALYRNLHGLAIDDRGTFYAVNQAGSLLYSYLYRFTKADVVDGAVTDLPPVDNTEAGCLNFYGTAYGALTWDPESRMLYRAGNSSPTGGGNAYLIRIDPETGKAEKANSTYFYKNESEASKLYPAIRTICIIDDAKHVNPATERAERLEIIHPEQQVLKGTVLHLDADVYPWYLRDKSLRWSSSDEKVATVNSSGVMTALEPGTVTITATTNAEPHLTSSYQVTVLAVPDLTLGALAYESDGSAYWGEFRISDPATWKSVSIKQTGFVAGGFSGETLLAHDGTDVYRVDPDLFEAQKLGTWSEADLWSDATIAPLQDGLFYGMAAVSNEGASLELIDPADGSMRSMKMTSQFGKDPMAAIAFARIGIYDLGILFGEVPAEFFYVITESGALYELMCYTYDNGGSYGVTATLLHETQIDLSGVSVMDGRAYASMYYDAESGYLILSHYQQGGVNELLALDPVTGIQTELGNFGIDRCPVVSLYQYDKIETLTLRLSQAEALIYENDVLQLQSRVLPTSSQGDVTWASSAPEIAAVDAQGTRHRTESRYGGHYGYHGGGQQRGRACFRLLQCDREAADPAKSADQRADCDRRRSGLGSDPDRRPADYQSGGRKDPAHRRRRGPGHDLRLRRRFPESLLYL